MQHEEGVALIWVVWLNGEGGRPVFFLAFQSRAPLCLCCSMRVYQLRWCLWDVQYRMSVVIALRFARPNVDCRFLSTLLSFAHDRILRCPGVLKGEGEGEGVCEEGTRDDGTHCKSFGWLVEFP